MPVIYVMNITVEDDTVLGYNELEQAIKSVPNVLEVEFVEGIEQGDDDE
jgi:translation elongation factor EF-1beta